jgi:hypothetical protein
VAIAARVVACVGNDSISRITGCDCFHREILFCLTCWIELLTALYHESAEKL